MHVTIAGVAANSGVFAQANNVVLISAHDYQAAALNTPVTYNAVDVTTANQAHTDSAVKDINNHFPLDSTQTVADALKITAILNRQYQQVFRDCGPAGAADWWSWHRQYHAGFIVTPQDRDCYAQDNRLSS